MTAVIRRAEAVLQAFIIMRSSMRPSLMSPGAVLCRMKTGGIRYGGKRGKGGVKHTIFVSDTGVVWINRWLVDSILVLVITSRQL